VAEAEGKILESFTFGRVTVQFSDAAYADSSEEELQRIRNEIGRIAAGIWRDGQTRRKEDEKEITETCRIDANDEIAAEKSL